MRLTKTLINNRKARPSLPSPGKDDTFPAPTGGWNTRDPLSGMDSRDALILDNYFPTTEDAVLRGGSTPWATGMPGVVETLIDYSKGTTEEMWAFSGNKIYNVSVTGPVGAATISGLTNNRWQYTTFTTSGDTRVVAVNGADLMRQYNGAVWAAIDAASAPIAITGVVTSTLINVWQHQRRLFFVQKNTMKAWYLPVDSFGGAAASVDLGTLFRKGGYLVAGGTWTRDGGDGMDDLCVFISSKGEVAIYQGNDPSVAASWQLLGRYEIGPPIGYRCFIKTGADLAIISIDGILGLSSIISLDRAASNKVALSNKIVGAYRKATVLYGSNFGWEAISYPGPNQVIFNIPVAEGVEQHQYVLNPLTGAWCRFKGLNGNTWCLHTKRVFFGDNTGKVWLADEGDSDNGQAITGLIKTAFKYQGRNQLKKIYKMVRPTLFSDYGLSFGVGIAVDFDDTEIAPQALASNVSGFSIWNVATWNVDPWATSVLIALWRKVIGEGRCACILFATNTSGFSIRVASFTLLYEDGGIL